MFGFIIGTLCLIGLVRVIARGRYGRRYGHFYGRGYGGFGPRSGLHAVLARLDAAPGQEKVISAAFSTFFERARESVRSVRDTRRTFAEALRGERLDEARLNEAFGQHDAALTEVRQASVDAMRQVHEALDERQRKILADLVEGGFGHHGFGHHGFGHHGFGHRGCGYRYGYGC